VSDRSLGTIIFILGLFGAIAYVFWLFWPAAEQDPLFYCQWIGVRWALVLPVFVAVTGILLIAMWIGWTMVATPPPIMFEDEIEEESEEQHAS
jgi:hypothetical protein